MKKINLGIGLMAMMLLMIGSVSASPVTGFDWDKHVVVKGDYEWTGSWQKTYPATATYDYVVSSPLATMNSVHNFDNLGTTWKYAGQTEIRTNAPAEFHSYLNAWTVNPPATTPGTAYTAYEFHEFTQVNDVNAASSVAINMVGNGNVNYESHTFADAESMQGVSVNIN